MKILEDKVKNDKDKYHYVNKCWNCGRRIDSEYNHRCEICGWYICSKCGSCSKRKH